MYKEIAKYFSERYPRWLEYAEYQADSNNLAGEGGDLLNFVLLDLLNKGNDLILQLYLQDKDNYSGLDFFILKMLRVNATSKTAPYKWAYHKVQHDHSAIIPLLRNMDSDSDRKTENGAILLENKELEDPWQDDQQVQEPNEYICLRSEQARRILSELDVPEVEKEIFRWKVFHDQAMSHWPHKDNVWRIYKKVKTLIINRVLFNEVREAIQQAINSIPNSNQRAVLQLIYYHGITPDILTTAGVNYIKDIYLPAKQTMKKILNQIIENHEITN